MQKKIHTAGLPVPSLPEVEGQGGINLGDVSTGESILLEAGPYLSFLRADKFDVYWGKDKVLVGQKTITDESTAFAYVKLDPAIIRDIGSGIHEYYYHYTPGLIGDGDDSPLPNPTVRVKLEVPGNPTPGPDPINDKLPAPTVDPMVIDSEQAELGVKVTIPEWENMSEGDNLFLLWGNETLKIENPAVGETVEICVPKETILAAMDNPKLPVRYRISDAVGNSSKLSPSTLVNVQATTTFFAMPKIIEAPAGILDLIDLAGADIHVQIDPEQDGIDIGDTVHLIWTGTTAAGIALPAEEYFLTVGTEAYITFTVPNAAAAPLAQGSALVYYIIKGRPSKNRHIDVIGEVETLKAPTIQEAGDDGILDPGKITDFAHIQVEPYTGMDVGDRVTYYWTGYRGGEPISFLSEFIDVSQSDITPVKKPLIFAVPKSEVERLSGATLDVYYIVKLDGQDPLPASPTLTLAVGGSDESDFEDFSSAQVKEYRYSEKLALPAITIQNADEENGAFSFFIADDEAEGMSGHYLLGGSFSEQSNRHQFFHMVLIPQLTPKSINFNFSHNAASGMHKLPIEITYSDGTLERRSISPGLIITGTIGGRTIKQIMLKNETPSYTARFDSFRFFY